MDTKDAKKFVELYLKEDESSLRSIDEIEQELHKHRDIYLNNLSEERKQINFEEEYKYIYLLNIFNKDYAKQLIRDVDLGSLSHNSRLWILAYGMYQAYTTGNMIILKNCLHTMNRLDYGYSLSTVSGSNHAGGFENAIYAFADCDIDLIKKYFPQSLGLADKNVHPFLRSNCNLIMGMIYKNPDWLEEARKQGLYFCNRQSSSKNDVLVVKYLLALSENNMQEASLLLQEIANSYRKTTWLFEFKNAFLKYFGVYVHGLYNLAHFALSPECFNQLVIPDHSVFWKEFDLFTKANGYVKGNLMLKLTGNLSTVKRLFDE